MESYNASFHGGNKSCILTMAFSIMNCIGKLILKCCNCDLFLVKTGVLIILFDYLSIVIIKGTVGF